MGPAASLFTTTPRTLRAVHNALSLQPNQVYDLGSFDGRPVAVRLLANGGAETTAQPELRSPPAAGSQVTPYERWAAAQTEGWSAPSAQRIGAATKFLSGLLQLATGRWTPASFNDNMAASAPGLPAVDIRRQLSSLGIDPKAPFTLNGRTFALNGSGVLATGNR